MGRDNSQDCPNCMSRLVGPNPQVRAKMSQPINTGRPDAQSGREGAAAKAKLASGGISGTGSLSQKEQPRSVEDIASALWDESVAG